MGYFSAFWSSSRYITELITGNKSYYRGGRFRQVSLYCIVTNNRGNMQTYGLLSFCVASRYLKHRCSVLQIQTTSSVTTVYPKKYGHGFVVLCFVVVMQSFIMNSHEVFIHIHQGCFAGTGAIVRLPQCQWSKPDGYGKISQCITITKHSKAKTVCIFLGIYCNTYPCP